MNCFDPCCLTLFLCIHYHIIIIIPFFHIHRLLICPIIRSDLIKLSTIGSNLLSLIILFDVRPQLDPANEFNQTYHANKASFSGVGDIRNHHDQSQTLV